MSENKTPAQNSDNQVPASEEREVNNNLETQYGTTTIDDVVSPRLPASLPARFPAWIPWVAAEPA